MEQEQEQEQLSVSHSSEAAAVSCILCCELIQFYAIGQCNHIDVCGICSYKIREIEDKGKGCIMCKVSFVL
jgi:hypothetical protein